MQIRQKIELENMIATYITSELTDLSRDELDADSNLVVEGQLDSVGFMRLVRYLESTLGVKIPPRDLVPKNFLTINAMIAYLTQPYSK